MKRFSTLAVAVALAAVIGCATQVTVTPTHRENMAAQAKVLAITARDLDSIVRQHHAEGMEEEAVRSVADFHTQAENFAGTVSAGRSDEKINTDYERLIKAYVRLDQTFPHLHADNPTQESYARVKYEYDKLARASGYSNRAYQRKIEEGK